MMSGSIYKKGLVVGIIILFLGLSIQPSIGTEIPVKKEIETIEDIEDCKPCQLEELLSKEDGIKTIGEELLVIRNKLEENSETNPICYFLYPITAMTLYMSLFFLALAYTEVDFFWQMFVIWRDRLVEVCDQWADYECPTTSICHGV
jgi:hypothetical protein